MLHSSPFMLAHWSLVSPCLRKRSLSLQPAVISLTRFLEPEDRNMSERRAGKRKSDTRRPVSVVSDDDEQDMAEMDATARSQELAEAADGIELEGIASYSRPARFYLKYKYTMNLDNLCKVVETKDSLVQFLQYHGLILRQRKCGDPGCDRMCRLEEKVPGQEKMAWRCKRVIDGQEHRFSESITKNTVFKNSHMSLKQLLRFFLFVLSRHCQLRKPYEIF